MSNISIKDSAGATKYTKATGAGSDVDPFIIEHNETNSAAIAASVDGVEALLTTIDADTGNMATSIASLDGKTPALGQALAATSVPVVLTAAQLSTLTPPAAIAGFATAANQGAANTSLANLDTKAPALGQALAAASIPVVLTAAQQTALTPPAAITGFATAANQATQATSLASIDTKTPALGQALAAAAVPVVLTALQLAALIAPQLAAGEAHIGQVGGGIARVSATFTRPADTTPYAAGDAVNDSTSAPTLIALAGMARVNGGSGYIVGLRISTNLKSITPRFRVRIFNANNPTLSNDNAAFQSKYADETKRVGRFDLPAMITPTDTSNSDMSSTEDETIRIPFVCAAGSTTLWLALETLDAFAPSSGQGWTIVAKADQN